MRSFAFLRACCGSPIPKGLNHLAQGCESASYPGWAFPINALNSNGVVSSSAANGVPSIRDTLPDSTPSELAMHHLGQGPRVARGLATLGWMIESLRDSPHSKRGRSALEKPGSLSLEVILGSKSLPRLLHSELML